MKAIFIFLVTGLLFSSQLLAQTVISGAVIGPKKSEGLTVVLLSSTGSRPLERVKTVKGGKFEISFASPDPKLTYQLGTRYNGELYATPPFTIKQGQRAITMDIEIQSIIEGPFLIKGKVTMTSGQPSPVDLQVILFEQLPNAKSQNPVMMRKTDEAGGYLFEANSANPGSKYFLGTIVGRVSAVSGFIAFKEGVKNLEINIEIPEVTTDQSRLQVLKNIVFFDLYEDYIQVSEMIVVLNLADSMVDTFDTPLQKALPTGTFYFEGPEKDDQSVTAFSGKTIIRALLPVGKSQIYYSYRLPKTNGNLTWGVIKGTENFELIHSGAGMNLDYLNQPMGSEKTTSSHQTQIFMSNKTKLSPDQTQVEVAITGLSIEQRKLFYPATFLLIFLLMGLFWFSKIRKDKEN